MTRNRKRREELGKALLNAGTYLLATVGVGGLVSDKINLLSALLASFVAVTLYAVGVMTLPEDKEEQP